MCRMVCEHVRQVRDGRDITDHLRVVANIDEAAPEAVELAQKLSQGAGKFLKPFYAYIYF